MDTARGGRDPKRGGRQVAAKTATGGGTRTKAPPAALVALAEARVAIEAVAPEIDGGRFPAKAVAGEPVIVEADIFSDGHDKIDAALLWRRADEAEWREAPMAFFDNDRWRGMFVPEANAPLSLHADRLARPLRELARRGQQEARGRRRHRGRAGRGQEPRRRGRRRATGRAPPTGRR